MIDNTLISYSQVVGASAQIHPYKIDRYFQQVFGSSGNLFAGVVIYLTFYCLE